MNAFTPKSAEEDPGAASKSPPRWAECLLRHALKPRDRESILGDLLEEYREERFSNLGRRRANLWYIRQMLGIVFFQAFKGSPTKRSIIYLCFPILAASAWLGFTEGLTVFKIVWMLVLGLLACYIPAVAGAHGRGSRKLWIGLILVSLLVGSASMMLGNHLLGTFEPLLILESKNEPFARQMTVYLLALTMRVSLSFCLGSFLAALLYKKRQAGSPSVLGLGSDIHKRQI